ncbi:hypothetical protein MKQ70_02695 [Chitinophaga sedimenti]|uniref:FKBP-type peptidyl-prolyl cis-trans isomerase n=1 Tax=Chitinophaga sedimenti TaxID=2033606 RepID=UPI002003AC31|nr:FKBP-type peptidyl-prolyl cis-trans isomerase [Chitinophaga sedimenti]MCK7553973.1 hypothetical protein [Chitinophaga sedimenti]
MGGRVFASNNKDTVLRAGIYDGLWPYRQELAVAAIAGTMPGLDDALLLLPAGTRVRPVLPSRMSYGAAGNSMLPPYTPLMFDLYILQ